MVRQFRVGRRHEHVVEIDIDATRDAYNRKEGDGGCSCVWCRNLRAQFEVFVPDPIRMALAEMGVDWRKPGETTSLGGPDAPLHYTVEYAAIGREISDGGQQEWGPTWLCVSRDAQPLTLENAAKPQVKLGFLAFEVPWVLEHKPEFSE